MEEATSDKNEWIESIHDEELRFSVINNYSFGREGDVVRSAFSLLETRIRQSTGLASHFYGKDLIDAAFHPETGRLQPVSAVGAERAGLHHLLLGLMLFYRNPIAHRDIYYDDRSFHRIVFLVDHALDLIGQASEQVMKLRQYVGPHEGQVQYRRDYRVDINSDGSEDLVVLIGLGKTFDDGELVPHLAPVVLEKRDSGFKRVPAPWIQGRSIYGATGLRLRNITGGQRPDIVFSWAWGETQDVIFALRYENERYSYIERDIPSGLNEPYSGPSANGFTIHGAYKDLNFADVDGDGLEEVIQTLLFDEEYIKELGYSPVTENPRERLAVCRVWKWNPETQLLSMTQERLVVETR